MGAPPESAPSSFPVRRPDAGDPSADSGDGRIQYRAARQGRDAVLAGKFDAVHVHASTFSPLAFLVARSCAGTVPTALTLHSLWSYAAPVFAGADALLGWRRWPLAWSAVSSVAAAELATSLKRAPVSVLPNAVSTQWWRAGGRAVVRRDAVGVVTTMRLSHRKRPMQLLRMMREVRAAVPAELGLTLTIIGDGPLRAKMLDYLRAHHMLGWVTLLGTLSAVQIRQRYSSADIYISPATLESFGIAALEARCAGLPVVAFSRTGISDFISDRREGLLVNSDREMVAAITSLVRAPALRSTISDHNVASVPTQSWARVTQAADQLYERAARLTRPGQRSPARSTLASAELR
ncbi:MAG: glycosyl transferase, group 1 [Frankiales bacterium]|nr:glycosyl transferase, group 1 [Frankiales bacterium]